MKSTQLLSVVLSLIMIFGVSAGSAFAQTDDLDDNSTDNDSFNADAYDDREEYDDTTDSKHHDLDDKLERFCDMTAEEKRQLFADHPRLEQFADRLENFCKLHEDERQNAIKAFIKDHVDEFRMYHDKDMKEILLVRYCDMTAEEKRQLFVDHPRLEQFADRLENFCKLHEDERQNAIKAFIKDHVDEFRMYHDKDMKEMLDRYCDLSNEDKQAFVAEHDKTKDHVAKMNKYCELDEDQRIDFIAEHEDEYKDHMKDKAPHMDYDRFCALEESDRALEIDNSEKLARITEWCNMTPAEREDYKMKHQDEMHDKAVNDKVNMMDKVHDKIAMSDISPRLKAIITAKHDRLDEKLDAIKMKYQEKYSDRADKIKSDLKMKYRDYLSTIKSKITDERKSAIYDRLSDMKTFKTQLRNQASDLTDEEKQQLRADFIDKAKDMQLAWISPRVQMSVGVDVAEIECRGGFSLVMKASNGAAMCVTTDTALKMIKRGIAVPAN